MSSKSGVGEVAGKRKSSTNEVPGKRRRVADTVVKILTPYYKSKRITSKVRDFRVGVGGGGETREGREGVLPFRLSSILKQECNIFFTINCYS